MPGAFEIPLTAQKMAQSGKYDAVICVGAVIRGDTSHYDLVCNESAKGIAQVELATGPHVNPASNKQLVCQIIAVYLIRNILTLISVEGIRRPSFGSIVHVPLLFLRT